MPKHRSKRGYPRNRSVVAPTGVPKHHQKCRSTNRSAEAPTGVPKHHRECRSTIRTSTHSFSGPRLSYYYMSFRTQPFIITFCDHGLLLFMFMFMFQFVFIFHIIFMFHEHICTYCISYIFLVSCLLHMAFHILIQEYLYMYFSLSQTFTYTV